MRQTRYARVTLIALCLSLFLAAPLWAEGIPYTLISAATANSTLVKAGVSRLLLIAATNTATTIRRVKLYDLAVAPTCGTSTPKLVIEVPPASSSGQLGGAAIDTPGGVHFENGIGLCIVTGQANSDATAGSAGDVVVNLLYE